MKSLFGGLLLAAGILVGGASGLCTIAMFVLSLGDGNMDVMPLALIFGGVPFLVGAALFLLGRMLIRSARAERAAEVATQAAAPADDGPTPPS